MVPKLVKKILEKKKAWAENSNVVLSYEEYEKKVKEVDPLAGDLVKVTADYLQDMGEVRV